MSKRWLVIAFLAVPLVAMLAEPSRAGIIFGRKKDKIDPTTRVPALIATLKNDKDADHRSNAAVELRTYDPMAFPDIVPALVSALQNDAKSGVRIEAALSLGKLRPVNQAAGEALERAVSTDPAMRVRLQARSTLMQYHWAGYRNGKASDIPPLAPAKDALKGGETLPPAVQTTPTPSRFPSTNEPPLAPVEPIPTPVSRPMPIPMPVEVKPMPMPSRLDPSRPAPMPSPAASPDGEAGPALP
jgi:hypothetical protein